MAEAKTSAKRSLRKAEPSEPAGPPEADRLGDWPHPRVTESLFGHEDALARVRSAMSGHHMPHAWVISGPFGIGKATFAYRIAAMLLDNRVSAPERTRRQIMALSHPGLFVLRRTWDDKRRKLGQSISMEMIRALRHFLTTTAGAGWRVVIVDRADELNVNSANALLKSLEEPPPATVFLLICTSAGRLPATLVSRCSRIKLRALGAADTSAAISQACALAGRNAPEGDAMTRLCQLARGSPGQALTLLEGPGLALDASLRQLFARLPDIDAALVHNIIDMAHAPGVADGLFFEMFGDRLRDIVRYTVEPGADQAPIPQHLMDAHALALWGELWETIITIRFDTERLNLDRAASVVCAIRELKRTLARIRSRSRA
jgi:DNA polymerase-3 subunit delta'